MLLLLVLTFCFILFYASAHGQLSVPLSRDFTERQFDWQSYLGYMPILSASGTEIVCRNLGKQKNPLVVNAGDNLDIEYYMHAVHPGWCSIYIGNEDTDEWYKIWELNDCTQYDRKRFQLTIPRGLKSGSYQVRWFWVALHRQSSGVCEWYANCVDINILNGENCAPSKVIKMPDVSSNCYEYWNPYANNAFFRNDSPITTFDCSRTLPSPSPSPSPQPQPVPIPSPSPSPNPQPQPVPIPSPSPSPNTQPQPVPIPSPSPSPNTQPQPTNNPGKCPVTGEDVCHCNDNITEAQKALKYITSFCK